VSLPQILLYLNSAISEKTHPSVLIQTNLKVTRELAFEREVLYRSIANLLKQIEIDDKSDAVHG